MEGAHQDWRHGISLLCEQSALNLWFMALNDLTGSGIATFRWIGIQKAYFLRVLRLEIYYSVVGLQQSLIIIWSVKTIFLK